MSHKLSGTVTKTLVSELSEPPLSTNGIISMYCVESTVSGICGDKLASSEFKRVEFKESGFKGVEAKERSADPLTDP